jgi:hypothetical protein
VEFPVVWAANLPANDQGILPLVAGAPKANPTDYEECLACQ